MNGMIRVLVACEESQAVTERLRARGIEAWSCDTLPTSGSHPEWHLQQDVVPLLKEDWHAVIAFPPCTHLAVSGAAWFAAKRADGRQKEGIDFFMQFARLKCFYAIENPVGVMSTEYRKPDQIVHPYYFGDAVSKGTCLWLNGLPPLVPTNMVPKPTPIKSKSGKSQRDPWHYSTWSIPYSERSRVRSKTFPGIADAMASQWGWFLHKKLGQ